jgi:glycosyltransferase involved in cell wall biosynthesis
VSLMIHVVTGEYPPTSGGLEMWTEEFVRSLVRTGVNVVVYVCGEARRETCNVERPHVLIDVGALRSPWEAPLFRSGLSEDRIVREIARLNLLILRNQIGAQVTLHTSAKHLIISNYALTVGYLSTLVASDIGLPHIAVIAGTDFSRGFRNAYERSVLQEVCRKAARVVCKSGEQARSLEAAFDIPDVAVIPTSVDAPQRKQNTWSQVRDVHIFSDCGFSYHKGTSVLLQSFETLVADGLPVKLTVCGTTAAGQKDYWADTLNALSRVVGDSLSVLGYLDQGSIDEFLCTASLYCSATLGEGSSAGRLAALCSGIPIVTTRCGEFVCEIPNTPSHVFVTEPGNAKEFMVQLRRMSAGLLEGSLEVDWAAVKRYRFQFSRTVEWSTWNRLLEDCSKCL